jgi:hypothetical protein
MLALSIFATCYQCLYFFRVAALRTYYGISSRRVKTSAMLWQTVRRTDLHCLNGFAVPTAWARQLPSAGDRTGQSDGRPSRLKLIPDLRRLTGPEGAGSAREKSQNRHACCIDSGALRYLALYWPDERTDPQVPRGRIRGDRSRVWPARRWDCVAIIAIVNGLGAKLNTKFTAINSSLK